MDGIRYTYEQVKDIVFSFGYILVSKEYINMRTKMTYMDTDGYYYYGTLANLVSNKPPSWVHKNNIYSIQNIKRYIKNNNFNVELLDDIYIDNRTKMKFRCSCYKVYECTWGKFYNRKQILCPECSLIQKGLNKRHKLEFLHEEYKKYGYRPLFDSYENCEVPLLCEDKDGYRGYLLLGNMRRGATFGRFKLVNPYSIYNMHLYIINNGIDVVLLEDDIIDFYAPINFRCACGNIYKTSWESFVDNKVHRCLECSKVKSRYAKYTEVFLEDVGVTYISEVGFSDCRFINKLRFDYMVTINDKFFLIEVDGEFHFENPFGESLLISQQEKDKIKDNYCQENNIMLLRLPYWEFNSDIYKEKILKTIDLINNPLSE